MRTAPPRSLPFHYAFVVIAITFIGLLVSQTIRATPGLLMIPFGSEFGWDRASISLGVGISLLTYGAGGPLGGTLVGRFGPRRLLVAAIALISLSTWALLAMRELWQFYVLWAIGAGVGTGMSGNVVSATIAHRWMRKHQGVVIGLFGGAISAGQLVFIPTMARVLETAGWRASLSIVSIAAAVVLVPIAVFMRDRPEDVGLRPYGEDTATAAKERPMDEKGTPLREAVRTRDFWLLAGSFFVCGYTSNGLIATHLIPHAVEHGFTEVTAASALALIGSLNIVGTLASGWLTDRYDPRKLLSFYYGFRATSLMALPFIYELKWLFLFAIVYGLDWIATVPPTVNLTARRFGRASIGTLYGWIWFAHMIGAAIAAYAGGFFRDLLGDYHLMFLSAAILGFVAVNLAARISPSAATPAAIIPEPAAATA